MSQQSEGTEARLRFTVYGAPAGQGSMRILPDRRTGRMRALHPTKTVAWRQVVLLAALAEIRSRGSRWPGLLSGPLAVRATFYLVQPRSARRRALPHVKPDLDKLLRAVGDALTGTVYADDSQVVSISAAKLYGEPPRAEIEVEAIPSTLPRFAPISRRASSRSGAAGHSAPRS